MSVKHIRKEVSDLLPIYKMIRDVLGGPSKVKAAGVTYLPAPDPLDNSEYGAARYESYVTRAIFFDATARSHEGFVGQMFYRETVLELPAILKPMIDDIDGQGTTLEQQLKSTAGEVLALGRQGLYTDYSADGVDKVTRQDQEIGRVRATIQRYSPERIINWRWSSIGNHRYLSLVVLEEDYAETDDGFETKTKTQYRELRMEPNDSGKLIFKCVVWREVDNQFTAMEPTYPKMGNGKNWDRIPFQFIGSSDNDPEVDKPPLEGMAHVNIGHYRNSAEYEETIFMMGQPTPWASGITENWLKEAWNGELRLGTREFIPLPTGGQMGLLQMTPNTMAENGMVQKEKQLVALGAKIMENKAVASTATEENRDSVIENSTLSSVAKNTSSAYTKAFMDALAYSNGSGKVTVEINTDFETSKLSAQERQQLMADWQGGGMTWEEYRWNMRRGGVVFVDDKVAREQIKEELEESIDLDKNPLPKPGEKVPPAEKVPPVEEE